MLASHPASPGLILGVHNNFSLDAAEIRTQDEGSIISTEPSSSGEWQARTAKKFPDKSIFFKKQVHTSTSSSSTIVHL